MLPQLERQFLLADLVQVRALLSQSSPDEDVIEYHQYSQRVRSLEARLAGMSTVIDAAPAGVALFFGGRPVVGSHGIQAEFGSKAIERFQTIVSQRFAAEQTGPLASKGRIPMKDSTHLLVTDVVRGSFGFVLQGAPDAQVPGVDTSLKGVVDRVADTLSRVAAQDETLFDGAVAEIDERQVGALTEFFKLLDTEGATMRIVEGERDFELDRASVQRARLRVENMRITDRPQELEGFVTGWTDTSGLFELRPHGGDAIIEGKVLPSVLDQVTIQRLDPYHKHVRVGLKVREVVARNRRPRTSYTLTSLALSAAPEEGSLPPSQDVRP